MTLTAEQQPDLRPVSNSPVRYTVAADWTCQIRDLTFEIPAGWTSDGMSIPRAVWSLAGLAPDGVQRAAALVHDYIYRYGGRGACNVGGTPISRAEADGILRDLCIAAGMSAPQAHLVHGSVRYFGWMFWGKQKASTARLTHESTLSELLTISLREATKHHPKK